MILLDFTYIHNSGGRNILEKFVTEIVKKKVVNDFIFLFDKRFNYNLLNLTTSEQYCILNNEFNRKIFYLKKRNQIQKVLCFGNIPPPVKVDCQVYIYFHNFLLLDSNNSLLSFKDKFILQLKRIYVKKLISSRFHWFVQTKFVKKNLQYKFGITKNNISLYPIFDEITYEKDENKKNEFIYVSSNAKHKNIQILIDAFIHASNKSKQKLILKLTLNEEETNYSKRFNINHKKLKILFLGNLDKFELYKHYSETKFLIYPSLKESFGLPLVEAAQFNCYILASDKNYVREVIEATQYFNAHSKDDISEKILYCMNTKNLKLPKLKVKNQSSLLLNKVLRE